jgi:uncharacterized protein YcfJ
MKRLAPLIPLLLSMTLADAAQAQETTVIQAENVRYAYAHVLKVTPVYQTLTATRIEQQCDQTPRPEDGDSKFSRVVGAVREAWRRNQTETAEAEPSCRSVPVERQFHRPIAYDVDYTYRGAKYRSRLPEDPGNRLRIRVSVVPVVAGARIP